MVKDFHDFYFLCCPECAYKSKDKLAFFDHAIENHPKSRAHVFSEVEPSYEAPEFPGYWISKPLPDGIVYNTPDAATESPVSLDTPDTYNRVPFNTPASTPRNIYNSPDMPDNYNRVPFNTPATPKKIYHSPDMPDRYDRVPFNTAAKPIKSLDTYPDTAPDTYSDTHDTYPDTAPDTYPDTAPDAFTEWTPDAPVQDEIAPADEMKEFTPKPFNAKYQCINCGIKEIYRSDLDTHITEEHIMKKNNIESYPRKKPFQCDECEMLKQIEMENAGEDLASESALQLHKSVYHEEKKHKKRYI